MADEMPDELALVDAVDRAIKSLADPDIEIRDTSHGWILIRGDDRLYLDVR